MLVTERQTEKTQTPAVRDGIVFERVSNRKLSSGSRKKSGQRCSVKFSWLFIIKDNLKVLKRQKEQHRAEGSVCCVVSFEAVGVGVCEDDEPSSLFLPGPSAGASSAEPAPG